MTANKYNLPSLIARIDYQQLFGYLERRGWEKSATPRPELAHFTSPDPIDHDNKLTILVPGSNRLRDYCDMAFRTIELVAEYENKNINDIIEQLLNYCDIFKTKVESNDTYDGSIPIDKCIELVSSIKELVIYSASAEIKPSRQIRRQAKEAINLAEKCKFGQTEYGSFIATFYLPLPSPAPQREIFVSTVNDSVPVQRRIVNRIIMGLHNIEEARRTEDYRIISDNYETGFNVNMCTAIIDLLDAFDEVSCGFSADLDPIWPFDIQSGKLDVKIGKQVTALVNRAVEEMLGNEVIREVDMTAYIYELHHESKKGPIDYQIKLLWQDKSNLYKIQTRLEPDDYRQACDAHKNEKPIKLKGSLERIGNRWFLGNPYDFEVVNENLDQSSSNSEV